MSQGPVGAMSALTTSQPRLRKTWPTEPVPEKSSSKRIVLSVTAPLCQRVTPSQGRDQDERREKETHNYRGQHILF
jgi:hypothetical protein